MFEVDFGKWLEVSRTWIGWEERGTFWIVVTVWGSQIPSGAESFFLGSVP